MMIAVTGSQGFVGKSLMAFALRGGVAIRPIARSDYLNASAFEGCDAVIHLAGLAHRKSATQQDFLKVNCELAVDCARTAAQAGAKRFIYVSSSKALRDFAENDLPLDEAERPSPVCDYGRSKLAAEVKLLALHNDGIIEVVVIRPALVVGSPAKANLRTLAIAAKWSRSSSWSSGFWHLAVSIFRAPKSYTSLENLCSALIFVAGTERGGGQVFHVVDELPMSTAILFHKLAAPVAPFATALSPLNSPPGPINTGGLATLVRWTLTCLGLRKTYNAIAQPFVLSGKKIQNRLGWKPQEIIDAELQRIMVLLPLSEDRSKR